MERELGEAWAGRPFWCTNGCRSRRPGTNGRPCSSNTGTLAGWGKDRRACPSSAPLDIPHGKGMGLGLHGDGLGFVDLGVGAGDYFHSGKYHAQSFQHREWCHHGTIGVLLESLGNRNCAVGKGWGQLQMESSIEEEENLDSGDQNFNGFQ